MKKTTLFAEKEQMRLPQNQCEAIVYFIAHLDIEMIDSILDDSKTYQYFPKHVFISKLMTVFEHFEKAGDKILSIHKGGCVGCSKGCRGFTFLGRKGDYMDILFEKDGDEINDIYDCANFVNDEEVPNKLNNRKINPGLFNSDETNLPF